MKRTTALLLSLLFVVGLAPRAAAAEPDGSQSRAEIVELDSAEAFVDFAQRCSRDVYSKNKIFRLTADIDLTTHDFSGVPYFAGSFYGGGHRILGLSLTADGSRQGLFRRVAEGAVIRDLSVNGTVAPGGTGEFVGGIAGQNAGRIINCGFYGTVDGLRCVGGIAGQNEASGQIERCFFSGSVSAEHQSGGIAGDNAGVLSGCTNAGNVNTEAIVPRSEAHFDLALLSEDNFLDLADFGGIAGSSDGVISKCKNNGNVGYKYTAYNVGGIVGKTGGFVTGCENSGLVNGRRDVGGIAGQLIPCVQWEFTNDKLQSLSSQLGSLNYLIGKASRHSSENSAAVGSELLQIGSSTEKATRELEKILRSMNANDHEISGSIHIDPDTGTVTVDSIGLSGVNTAGLTSALADISAESSVLSGILRDSFDELTEDMAKILRQMSGIMGGMVALLGSSTDGELYETIDLSANESYEHDLGALDACVNYGEVCAETHAGGVVGTIGFEISFDMEDTLDASRFITADARQLVFAVARGCKSHSEVQAKNDHAGCVAGSIDVGAAVDCVGTGAATALGGDYVGGIAGESKGTVRACWSRAMLSGKKYVGGIAGFARDIISCRCWAFIESAAEYAGAVAGWSDGEVSGNLYVDSSPAGIDNVSFSGMTDPLTSDELLALPDIPDNISDLTVRFVVGDTTVASVDVPFGGSIDALPSVDNDGARYWKWDDFNREHIYHSMTVGGKYYAPGTTLSSGEEIPVFLVEGVFYEGQRLTVIPCSVPEEDALAAYTLFVDGYEGPLTVHMLCGEDGKPYRIDADGERIPVSSRVDGQYVLFELENGGSFVFLLAPPIADYSVWIIAGGSLLAVAVIAALMVRRKKKRSSAVSNETETTSGNE